jgi:hypothetical protein
MIPKECKRLAELDFPIAVVSKHSAREKSSEHYTWQENTVRLGASFGTFIQTFIQIV